MVVPVLHGLVEPKVRLAEACDLFGTEAEEQCAKFEPG